MASKIFNIKTTYIDVDNHLVHPLSGVTVVYNLIDNPDDVYTIETNYTGTSVVEINGFPDSSFNKKVKFVAVYPQGYDTPIVNIIDVTESTESPIDVELQFTGNPDRPPESQARTVRVKVTYTDVKGDGSKKPLQLANIKYCTPTTAVDRFVVAGKTNSLGICTFTIENVEESLYKIAAEHIGFNDHVAVDVDLFNDESSPIQINLNWPYNPDKIPEIPEGEYIPYEEPSWIYEGTDAGKYELGTGEVLNRAPKEIQKNIKALFKYIQARLKYTDLYNRPLFNIEVQYNFQDIVLDDYGRAYICINPEGSKGNPLTDENYWKVIELAGSGSVLNIDGGYI